MLITTYLRNQLKLSYGISKFIFNSFLKFGVDGVVHMCVGGMLQDYRRGITCRPECWLHYK